jgi:hypothetical protein
LFTSPNHLCKFVFDTYTYPPEIKIETEEYINKKKNFTSVDLTSEGSIDTSADKFRIQLPIVDNSL